MKNITRLIFYFTILAAAASCTAHDDAPGSEGGVPVVVTIMTGTRGNGDPALTGYHDGDPVDSRIRSLRVLGYHSSNGVLAFNETITVTDPDAAVEDDINIFTGDFTFVFIANEGSGQLSGILADDSKITTLARLKELSFGYDQFDEGTAIPMATFIEGVKVTGDRTLQAPDQTVVNGTWHVKMERLAVRLELELEMAEYFADEAVLWFDNVPDRVYLYPRDNSADTHKRTVAASLRTSNVASAGGRTFKWNRIILPESVFTPVTDKTKAVVIGMSTAAESKEGLLGFEPGTDYTMPRNYYFKVTGTVKATSIECRAEVVDWDTQLENTIMDGQYYLDVSASRVLFNRFGNFDLKTAPAASYTFTVETDYSPADAGMYDAGLKIEFPAGMEDWLDYSVTQLDGIWKQSVTVTPTTINYGNQPLRAEITVTAGNLKKTIVVEQDYRIADFFARSNVVYDKDNGRLTFAVTRKDHTIAWPKPIPAAASGILFKYGSLIGISSRGGGPTNDSSKSIDMAASHAVFRPDKFTGTIAGADKSLDLWNSIPYFDFTDITSGGDTYPDDLYARYPGKGYDAEQAKGDICRYISDQGGWVQGKWRMPTAKEIECLLAETTASSYDVSNANATDPDLGKIHYNKVRINVFASNYTSTDMSGYFPTTSAWLVGYGDIARGFHNLNSPLLNDPGDGFVLVPPSGYRTTQSPGLIGKWMYLGSSGGFWSSTTLAAGTAYRMTSHEGDIGRASSDRTMAYAVRCIRDITDED